VAEVWNQTLKHDRLRLFRAELLLKKRSEILQITVNFPFNCRIELTVNSVITNYTAVAHVFTVYM